jgi:membrane fusion protein (multidrug efflux system)
MNVSKRARIFALVVLIVGIISGYYLIHRGEESTDDATIEADVVTIAPKVNGYVKALYVHDNQFVKAGDVLLEIDPTDYIISLNRAQANVDAAQASYQASSQALSGTKISAPSTIDVARAQVNLAQANWVKATKDLERMRKVGDLVRSRAELDTAIAQEKIMRASLEDAKARLRAAQTAPTTIAGAAANQAQLAAQLKSALADLAQAQQYVADTKIVAASDGYITRRGISRGDYVQPGQQLAYLVGKEVWVIANFKETQLKNMRRGQKVAIHIDALPDIKAEGKVDSIQSGTGVRFSAFPPENATGNFVKVVQRVPVKIVFTTPATASLLAPGISVEPTVFTR